MSDEIGSFDNKGLLQLLKALKDSAPVARVGVLGGKDIRKNSDSNATIGMKHEFGQEGMPIRSFLRTPLIDQMQNALDKSNAFTEDVAKDIIKQGSFTHWVRKLGMVAEEVIAEAFKTGGFGKWKPSNMFFKTVHQTLVETTQLRDSITSEVKEG